MSRILAVSTAVLALTACGGTDPVSPPQPVQFDQRATASIDPTAANLTGCAVANFEYGGKTYTDSVLSCQHDPGTAFISLPPPSDPTVSGYTVVVLPMYSFDHARTTIDILTSQAYNVRASFRTPTSDYVDVTLYDPSTMLPVLAPFDIVITETP